MQRKPRQLSRRTEGIKLEEVRWSGGNVGFAGQTFVMILCIVNLINYVDRGVIASNGVNGGSTPCDSIGLCSAGTGIQGEFRLSNFQDGFCLLPLWFVGVGEASFISLAAPYIDDSAPAARRVLLKYGSLVSVISMVVLFVYLVATPQTPLGLFCLVMKCSFFVMVF